MKKILKTIYFSSPCAQIRKWRPYCIQ